MALSKGAARVEGLVRSIPEEKLQNMPIDRIGICLTKVRISIWTGQPFDAPPVGRLAHGLRPAYMDEVNALIAAALRMALSKGRSPASKGTPVVYILRLRSGALYIGASEHLDQRLEDHVAGQACRTTQLDAPAALIWLESFSTFSEARNREAQLKRWSRAKKEALVKGDVERLHALSQSREARHR